MFPVMLTISEGEDGQFRSPESIPDFLRLFEQGRVIAPRLQVNYDIMPPELRIQGGGSPFEGEDATIAMSEEMQKLISEERSHGTLGRMSGIAVGDKNVITIESANGPDRGSIICITKPQHGRIPGTLWKASMDARWRNEFKGSEWFTELRTNQEDVLLFHATHDSLGIEAFRIIDGKRLFSFNSRLPDHHSRSSE